MKRIENYETIEASSGEFARPTAGGYICKIINVEDVPMNEQGKGDYIRVEYDIADGEFKDYYKEQFDKWGGNWNASFIRSYKPKARGMFKHFTNCIEKSNAGYTWDFDECSLIGKVVGLVIGEEEYKNSMGEIKKKMVVSQVKTVEEIKNGDFTVPKLKEYKEEVDTNSPFMQFTPVKDDTLPF